MDYTHHSMTSKLMFSAMAKERSANKRQEMFLRKCHHFRRVYPPWFGELGSDFFFPLRRVSYQAQRAHSHSPSEAVLQADWRLFCVPSPSSAAGKVYDVALAVDNSYTKLEIRRWLPYPCLDGRRMRINIQRLHTMTSPPSGDC